MLLYNRKDLSNFEQDLGISSFQGEIRDVKKTSGYLATAGMSRLRVSITFTDRSVLKSFAPIEISPKDRDGFIEQLVKINPDIKEL